MGLDTLRGRLRERFRERIPIELPVHLQAMKLFWNRLQGEF